MTSPPSFEIASPLSRLLFLPPIHVASLLVRLRLIGKTCLPCRRAQAPSASDQEHNLNFVTRKGNIVVVFRLKEENIFKKRLKVEISLVTWTSPPWRRRALPTGSPSMGLMEGPEEKEDNEDSDDYGDRDWLS